MNGDSGNITNGEPIECWLIDWKKIDAGGKEDAPSSEDAYWEGSGPKTFRALRSRSLSPVR